MEGKEFTGTESLSKAVIGGGEQHHQPPIGGGGSKINPLILSVLPALSQTSSLASVSLTSTLFIFSKIEMQLRVRDGILMHLCF